MNKKKFLEELEKGLSGLKEEDIKEILEDYKEHFKVGKKKKRKESEIAESLGNPKEIAREAKKELGEVNHFKEDLKKFGETIEDTTKNFYNSLRKYFKEKKKKQKKKDRKEKKGKTKKSIFWKAFGLFSLNFLLMIWLFFSLYAISFSLFVAGGSIVFSGFVTFFVTLFILITKTSPMLNHLAISGVFASLGLIALGLIWLKLTQKLTKSFSWLINRYYKWHRRVLKK